MNLFIMIFISVVWFIAGLSVGKAVAWREIKKKFFILKTDKDGKGKTHRNFIARMP